MHARPDRNGAGSAAKVPGNRRRPRINAVILPQVCACKGARPIRGHSHFALRIQTVAVNAPPSRYPIIAFGRFPACPGPGGLWFLPTGFSGGGSDEDESS
jgi:hypothetical protein